MENTKNKVNDLFQGEINIMNEIYELIGVVYMPSGNHFCAAIFNYNGDINNRLKKGKNYFYDSIKENGKIIEIDESLNIYLLKLIKHLFIYSKK